MYQTPQSLQTAEVHHKSTTTPIRQWVRTDAGIWVPADPLIQLIVEVTAPLITLEKMSGSVLTPTN